MAGFELRTPGMESNRSVNWATTTTPTLVIYIWKGEKETWSGPFCKIKEVPFFKEDLNRQATAVESFV